METVNETSTRKNIPHQPLTLLKCAQNCIMHESYPLLVLKVAYAKLCYLISYSDWLNNATVNMSTCIPRKLAGKPNVYIDLFCYPEYNVLCHQIEPRTLDYSHIITNVRAIFPDMAMTIVKRNISFNCAKNDQTF